MIPRGISDTSVSVIDYSRVMLQIVMSLTSFIYNHSKFIAQATEELYSWCFIYVVIYKKDQLARVLHYSKLKRLESNKHPSLFDPFILLRFNP